MSQDRKLPKTNSALPSINYKQFISLIILLLVTSSTSQSPTAKYDCPSSCECDEATLSARCDDLNELIASYSRKQHKTRENLMPIKSLDLSNNQLTKLTNQLEILVNLTELNLSHNQLTQVHKLNFANLKKLDLSHNRITSAKLKKLPKNVAELNLGHNEITYLPVDFMKLKQLRTLELVGNPLNCTCNTLHVRNWITFHHVWSDNHILCASPAIVKGQPWLQARQNDICIEPSSTTTQRSKYNWDNYEDDNEIMMGDQPQADEQSDNVQGDEPDDTDYGADDDDVDYNDGSEAPEKAADDEDTPKIDEEEPESDVFADDEDKKDADDADEKKDEEVTKKSQDNMSIDDDFMPVSQEPEHDHHHHLHEPENVSEAAVDADNDSEGSGADNPDPSVQPEEDTNESGSGMLPILIPSKDDLESSTDDSSVPSLGIFEDNTEVPIGGHIGAANPHEVETEMPAGPNSAVSDQMNKASTDDNTGTYILLGILALCLISLMIFVAMKNKQEKKRNRRYDVERNGATELQEMDKRLLGKPMENNGNGNGKTEHAPLINDYPVQKENRPQAYTSFQPTPSINIEEPKAAPRDKDKSQQSLYENHNGNGQVEPVHQSNGSSIPKLPDSDDETFHPAVESPTSLNVSPEPTHQRYSPIYTPASPRSERYSPVYSPETGRVKIKLTETPKPKTPVVVTRSRSRAGDYINTPN